MYQFARDITGLHPASTDWNVKRGSVILKYASSFLYYGMRILFYQLTAQMMSIIIRHIAPPRHRCQIFNLKTTTQRR